MNALLSLLFAVILHPHPVAPYVTQNVKMGSEIHMTIKNPLPRRVIVTIHCGGEIEYSESEVWIERNQVMEVAIETAPPADYCNMSSWR